MTPSCAECNRPDVEVNFSVALQRWLCWKCHERLLTKKLGEAA